MSADNWTACPKCGKTMREDYDIGIVEGIFEVEYSAICKNCGFSHEFKAKHEV